MSEETPMNRRNNFVKTNNMVSNMPGKFMRVKVRKNQFYLLTEIFFI